MSHDGAVKVMASMPARSPGVRTPPRVRSWAGRRAVAGGIHTLTKDVARFRRADAVVAGVTVPGLGVGYDIGKATEWDTPTQYLYRPASEHDLSAMTGGSDAVTVAKYDDPATLESVLAAFVDRHR